MALLYLRGAIRETVTGDSVLSLEREIEISRSWLRQQIRNSTAAQQIIILDCYGTDSLQSWLDDLELNTTLESPSVTGQCLMAGISQTENLNVFTQTLLTTLQQNNSADGCAIASWITQIQQQLPTDIWRNFYLSGVRGIIEVIPAGVARNSNYADVDVCPYRGLQAFRELDERYFFGRESLVQTLIDAIASRNFIPVVGASGSGKSSAVRAGLMARLRSGNYIPQSNTWWLKVLRPGNKPLQTLA